MKRTGDEYFDSEEFRDKLAEYEKAVSEGEPVYLDADELAEIADYYQMTDHFDEAEAAIKLALSLSPGAVAPLTYRIHEALWRGDTKVARDYLHQIIERSEPDYVYCNGEILLAENKAEEADNFFLEELDKVPEEEYQDYVIDVANIFQDYEQNEKAMQWMARANQEDTPDFKELMARTLFGLGKYKDSARLFNELIDTDPFSKYYWNALASAQFMNEDYSASVQSSEYAIAIDPDDAEGIMAKANGLYQLGNFEEALHFFRRYSEHVPDDEYAVLHQATCLINLGQNQEAINLLEDLLNREQEEGGGEAAEESPYMPDLLQELAFAYSEQGECDKAMELLNRTDVLDCDHTQLQVIKGHVLLADGRVEKAEECYRKAIIHSDQPNQTLLRVIVSIYDNHYLETAYKLFNKYFSIVGTRVEEGYAYMALCCYDLKRNEEFLNYLKIACERNPKECRQVLGHLFPEDMEPEEYYSYIINKLKS